MSYNLKVISQRMDVTVSESDFFRVLGSGFWPNCSKLPSGLISLLGRNEEVSAIMVNRRPEVTRQLGATRVTRFPNEINLRFIDL